MKKRPRRPATKSSKSVATRAREAPRTLQYKVVELSTVDEGSIEETVNQYVRQGWSLDGVQFAMREASKRPAMAFVFFTRSVEMEAEEEAPTPAGQARARLVRLATSGPVEPPAHQAMSASERLRRLAELEDDEDDDGDGEDDA